LFILFHSSIEAISSKPSLSTGTLPKPDSKSGNKCDILNKKCTTVTKLSAFGHSPAYKLGRLPVGFRKKVFFSKG